MGMNECCATCRHRYDLERLDYSNGGCEHTEMDGYICMAFADERQAVWIIRTYPLEEICECYKARRENDGRI